MNDPKRYLDLLANGRAGDGLESAGAVRTDAATRSELLERLLAEVAYVEQKTGVNVDADALNMLLVQAKDGLSRLFGDGESAVLGRTDVSGLEAVIRANGSRPVLFVEDDFVDLLAPSIGTYATRLSLVDDAIRQVCRCVGRVDDPSPAAKPLGYHGTAWMLTEGLVVTNYHVLMAIAPGGVRENGRFQGRLNTGVAVHFGHEVGSARPERRFPIRRVVSVGQAGADHLVHPEFTSLNFDGLDLAILELEPVPGRPFPAPCRIARGDDKQTRGRMATAGREVYLVGYPGASHSTTPDLFSKIFSGVKSFKRLAPGQIVAAPGDLPKTEDPRGWILTHDASTLGGNSGSAVVDLESDGGSVLGLHFAGHHLRQNWAHATEKITPELGAVLPPIGV